MAEFGVGSFKTNAIKCSGTSLSSTPGCLLHDNTILEDSTATGARSVAAPTAIYQVIDTGADGLSKNKKKKIKRKKKNFNQSGLGYGRSAQASLIGSKPYPHPATPPMLTQTSGVGITAATSTSETTSTLFIHGTTPASSMRPVTAFNGFAKLTSATTAQDLLNFKEITMSTTIPKQHTLSFGKVRPATTTTQETDGQVGDNDTTRHDELRDGQAGDDNTRHDGLWDGQAGIDNTKHDELRDGEAGDDNTRHDELRDGQTADETTRHDELRNGPVADENTIHNDPRDGQAADDNTIHNELKDAQVSLPTTSQDTMRFVMVTPITTTQDTMTFMVRPATAPQDMMSFGMVRPETAPQDTMSFGMVRPETAPQDTMSFGMVRPAMAPQDTMSFGMVRPATAPQDTMSFGIVRPATTSLSLAPASTRSVHYNPSPIPLKEVSMTSAQSEFQFSLKQIETSNNGLKRSLMQSNSEFGPVLYNQTAHSAQRLEANTTVTAEATPSKIPRYETNAYETTNIETQGLPYHDLKRLVLLEKLRAYRALREAAETQKELCHVAPLC